MQSKSSFRIKNIIKENMLSNCKYQLGLITDFLAVKVINKTIEKLNYKNISVDFFKINYQNDSEI